MSSPRGIVTDIEATGLEAQYDATCKRILANRYVLANILKLCVPEFNGYSVKDIAEKYIDTIPGPGSIDLDVDATNKQYPDNIVGAGTEDATRTEGKISYDVRFDAWVPNETDKIELIINVEAQNKFKPEYPILKRAEYYASRLISAQKGKYWFHSEYQKLRKVYTIWLCMNPPKQDGFFCNIYELKETPILGNKKFPAQDYHHINIVIVGLSKKATNNAVLDMLSTVFSTIATKEEKLAALEQNDVPCEYIEEEVNHMCNLSQGVLDLGIQQGANKRLIDLVSALMETTNSFARAAELLNLSEEDIAICADYFDVNS